MLVPFKYSKVELFISWSLQIIAAMILLQTLYFKFSGAAESIYIFQKAGAEPWGRYSLGIIELIAAILLCTPARVWMGALLTILLMTGAILFHLFFLGISVQNDHGTLFILAVITWASAVIILYIRKNQVPFINRHF